MARWHNIRLRGDLYEVLFHRATQDRRSVAQMADVLLTRALDQGPEATGSSASLTRGGLAAPGRAPVAQRTEGQATVDEMLASCPQCAGELREAIQLNGGRQVSTVRCVDCGWVREPTG